jgi:hypothetical protein
MGSAKDGNRHHQRTLVCPIHSLLTPIAYALATGDGGAYPECHVAQYPLNLGKKKVRSVFPSVDIPIDRSPRHKRETPSRSRSIPRAMFDTMPSHTKARGPESSYSLNSKTSSLFPTGKTSPMINAPWRDRPKRKFRPLQNGLDKRSKSWSPARLKLPSPRTCQMQLVRRHTFAILLVNSKVATVEH